MYNTTDMSLNGLAGIDPAVCADRCYSTFRKNAKMNEGVWDKEDHDNNRSYLKGCLANCGAGTIVDGRIVNRGGGATATGAQSFINNQALTVSAPRPLVSPARVNPTFSQVPAYTTQAVPFSAYGDNATYGTYGNPIRLGVVDPATVAAETPNFIEERFKKENLPTTIGVTAGILVVGYFAYKEFGSKKSTRRRR